MSKGLLLVVLAILAIVLVGLLYLLPSPWRLFLAIWILVVVPVGLFALRLIQHHYDYKRAELTTRPRLPEFKPVGVVPTPRRHAQGVPVVHSTEMRKPPRVI